MLSRRLPLLPAGLRGALHLLDREGEEGGAVDSDGVSGRPYLLFTRSVSNGLRE